MRIGRRAYLWCGLVLGPLAVLGLRAYTKITKAPRVRVIVENESGKILLIKNVLAPNSDWTLPGGGVSRGESPKVAAQRELREETGIVTELDDFKYVTTLKAQDSGLNYEAPVYYVLCPSLSLPASPINTREIADIGWFHPNSLPLHTAKLVGLAMTAKKKNNRGKSLRSR